MRSAFFFFLNAYCLAQTNTATINGSVTDPRGAVISDAEVIAVQDATGIRSAVRTNEAGLYAIPSLGIGRYSLNVEKPGFRRYVRAGFLLTTGQNLELNATLDLGAVTETVNVSPVEPLLSTRASEVGQTIDAKLIEDLPLAKSPDDERHRDIRPRYLRTLR